jgi:hypothetical protein
MPETGTPFRPHRLLWGLVLALAAWGIYLAVGATGIFTDVGLFDARRSVIVLICSAAFLCGWLWLLLLRRRSPGAPSWPTNRCSLASLLCAVLAYGLWAGAWMAWDAGNPDNLNGILGWTSLGAFALSAVLALIGLSDPQRKRGKLAGLVTLGLLWIAIAGLIVQVRHFTSQQTRPLPPVQPHSSQAAAQQGA